MIKRLTKTIESARTRAGRRLSSVTLLAIAVASFFTVLVWSGVTAFQRQAQPAALAATDQPVDHRPTLGDRPAPQVVLDVPVSAYEEVGVAEPANEPRQAGATQRQAVRPQPARSEPQINLQPGVKIDRFGKIIMVNGRPWTGEVFDHRPIRPVRTRTMKTTAYSPDARSCGKWADGITASGKSVWMNGGRLVAADRSIPYGTILTIPGYNHGRPVQVWDRGGAIKGNRLDLLYPTHKIALQWGVQDLPVVFWAYVEMD